MTPSRIAVLALALSLVPALGPIHAEPASPPEADWFPSPFGAEDRIGAANHLSPEIVKQAAGLITHGKAYSLGMEVNAETPAYPPRQFQMVVTQSNDGTGPMLGENQATANDDDGYGILSNVSASAWLAHFTIVYEE